MLLLFQPLQLLRDIRPIDIVPPSLPLRLEHKPAALRHSEPIPLLPRLRVVHGPKPNPRLSDIIHVLLRERSGALPEPDVWPVRGEQEILEHPGLGEDLLDLFGAGELERYGGALDGAGPLEKEAGGPFARAGVVGRGVGGAVVDDGDFPGLDEVREWVGEVDPLGVSVELNEVVQLGEGVPDGLDAVSGESAFDSARSLLCPSLSDPPSLPNS